MLPVELTVRLADILVARADLMERLHSSGKSMWVGVMLKTFVIEPCQADLPLLVHVNCLTTLHPTYRALLMH